MPRPRNYFWPVVVTVILATCIALGAAWLSSRLF